MVSALLSNVVPCKLIFIKLMFPDDVANLSFKSCELAITEHERADCIARRAMMYTTLIREYFESHMLGSATVLLVCRTSSSTVVHPQQLAPHGHSVDDPKRLIFENRLDDFIK